MFKKVWNKICYTFLTSKKSKQYRVQKMAQKLSAEIPVNKQKNNFEAVFPAISNTRLGNHTWIFANWTSLNFLFEARFCYKGMGDYFSQKNCVWLVLAQMLGIWLQNLTLQKLSWHRFRDLFLLIYILSFSIKMPQHKQ